MRLLATDTASNEAEWTALTCRASAFQFVSFNDQGDPESDTEPSRLPSRKSASSKVSRTYSKTLGGSSRCTKISPTTSIVISPLFEGDFSLGVFILPSL